MIDTGYRRSSSSDLFVPAEMSREREVWTRDEWKLLERATKLLETRGIELYMGCPQCKKAPIEKSVLEDGSMTLRCAHKDRVFRRDL